MNDSAKLFLSAAGIFVAGLMKGIAPMVIDQPFDTGSFAGIAVIAVIVMILGIVKFIKGE